MKAIRMKSPAFRPIVQQLDQAVNDNKKNKNNSKPHTHTPKRRIALLIFCEENSPINSGFLEKIGRMQRLFPYHVDFHVEQHFCEYCGHVFHCDHKGPNKHQEQHNIFWCMYPIISR